MVLGLALGLRSGLGFALPLTLPIILPLPPTQVRTPLAPADFAFCSRLLQHHRLRKHSKLHRLKKKHPGM